MRVTAAAVGKCLWENDLETECYVNQKFMGM